MVGRHPLQLFDLLQEFLGSRHKAGSRGKPGAGRAKLRLSRGFPRCLAYDVIPYNLVDQLTKEFWGVASYRQVHPESPGSGGASPYQPALPRLRRYPLQIGRPIDKGILGGRVTRQDHAESPGAGRAKLRLSRGFPCCLAHGVAPTTWSAMGRVGVWALGHIARQDHPGSPGSDGASPYQPALPRLRRCPLQIGRPFDKGIHGGRVTRQDDAENPGSGRASTLPKPTAPQRPHTPNAKRRYASRRHVDTFPLEPHPTNMPYALFLL